MRARPHRVVVLLRVWGRLAPFFEAIFFLIFIQFTVLRRIQPSNGRDIRFELLALLDTEREKHAHHLEVFGLRRLLVQRAGEALSTQP